MRRLRASRPDSAGGEGEELEAELVAAMACFGAAEIDGELDGGRGELRLDRGFPLGQRTRERGKMGRAGKREQVGVLGGL